MLFLTDVDHVSFEKANETRKNNLQSATVSLQVVIDLCKSSRRRCLTAVLSHHRASDCLTIRKSSLMYGIFIFDFFNIIFIFVFHMNYICSSPCYITLSSNFVTNSSVENMLNNRLKL